MSVMIHNHWWQEMVKIAGLIIYLSMKLETLPGTFLIPAIDLIAQNHGSQIFPHDLRKVTEYLFFIDVSSAILSSPYSTYSLCSIRCCWKKCHWIIFFIPLSLCSWSWCVVVVPLSMYTQLTAFYILLRCHFIFVGYFLGVFLDFLKQFKVIDQTSCKLIVWKAGLSQ